MAKTIVLFLLVISVGYMAATRAVHRQIPLNAPLAEASDSVDSGYDTEDTDFC